MTGYQVLLLYLFHFVFFDYLFHYTKINIQNILSRISDRAIYFVTGQTGYTISDPEHIYIHQHYIRSITNHNAFSTHSSCNLHICLCRKSFWSNKFGYISETSSIYNIIKQTRMRIIDDVYLYGRSNFSKNQRIFFTYTSNAFPKSKVTETFEFIFILKICTNHQ